MKPVRNPQYLAWIRSLPCVVCGITRGIEAAHTGPHGLGQKSPDTSAIPLCVKHHRTGKDSYHRLGPRKFSEAHDVDVAAIVLRLNRKPVVRIEAGSFVGYLEDEQYVLGNVSNGVAPAIRAVRELCWRDRYERYRAS